MNGNGFFNAIGNFLLKDGKKNSSAIAVGYLIILLPIVFLAGAARGNRSFVLALVPYGLVFLLNGGLAYLILNLLIRVKRAEEGHSQLASIIECAEAAILSETLNGEIVTWNKGAERVYGYTKGRFRGARSIFCRLPSRPEKPSKFWRVYSAVKLSIAMKHCAGPKMAATSMCRSVCRRCATARARSSGHPSSAGTSPH